MLNTGETGAKIPNSVSLSQQNSDSFQSSSIQNWLLHHGTQIYKCHFVDMQWLSRWPELFRDINLKAWTNSLGFPLSCSFLKSIFVNHVLCFQGNQVGNTSCKQPPSIHFSWLQGSQKLFSVWQRSYAFLYIFQKKKSACKSNWSTQQACTEISVDPAIWSTHLITIVLLSFCTYFPQQQTSKSVLSK